MMWTKIFKRARIKVICQGCGEGQETIRGRGGKEQWREIVKRETERQREREGWKCKVGSVIKREVLREKCKEERGMNQERVNDRLKITFENYSEETLEV